MFRFYLELRGSKYVVLNDIHNIVNSEFTPAQIKSVSKFVEIEYDSRDHGYKFDNLGVIKPMDVDYINGAAIKAANDHNETILRKNAIKNDFAPDAFKRMVQEIVDMRVEYGDKFNDKFEEALKKWRVEFPVKKTVITEKTIILG